MVKFSRQATSPQLYANDNLILKDLPSKSLAAEGYRFGLEHLERMVRSPNKLVYLFFKYCLFNVILF